MTKFFKKLLNEAPGVYTFPIKSMGDACGSQAYARILRLDIIDIIFRTLLKGTYIISSREANTLIKAKQRSILIGHPERKGYKKIMTDSGQGFLLNELNSNMKFIFLFVCSGSRILSWNQNQANVEYWVSFRKKIYIPVCKSRTLRKYFKKFYRKIEDLIWITEDLTNLEFEIKRLYFNELNYVNDRIKKRNGRDLIIKILQRQYNSITSNISDQ